jgi:hypothetical protein
MFPISEMKWIKEWNFEILIQNNETNEIVHRWEVIIEWFYNISVPKPKTELSTTNITLKVWESKIVG